MSVKCEVVCVFLVIYVQDTVETGSVSKVVDCILSLKLHQEWKRTNTGNGYSKHVKSPLGLHSASRMHSKASVAFSSEACRRLDLSATSEKEHSHEGDFQKQEGLVSLSLAHISTSYLHRWKYLNLLLALISAGNRLIVSSFLTTSTERRQNCGINCQANG